MSTPLWNRLMEICADQGINPDSQKGLMQLLGVTSGRLSQLKTDPNTKPGAKTIGRLTDLGYRSDWILSGTGRKRKFLFSDLKPTPEDERLEEEAERRWNIELAQGNIAAEPRPVYVVDEDSPVGDDEVEVPRLTLKLSAGSGRLNWEIDEKGSPNRFRKSWCRRKGLKPEALVTVPVAGDSMAPTIPDGASVTINTAETALRNGKPHAIDYMGEFFIKRLFRQPDGSVMVRSDNPDKTRHPDWDIPPEHGDALRILGAPVAISADLD